MYNPILILILKLDMKLFLHFQFSIIKLVINNTKIKKILIILKLE